MLKLKNWFYDKFGFSKREFNGLLGLSGLAFILTVLPYLYSFYKSNQIELSADENIAIHKLELEDRRQENNSHFVRRQIEEAEFTGKVSLFNFDPNTIDLAGWQRLGLSIRQANSIINYRNKGGKFYKPEDLQRMYTIKPEKYQALLPYIHIENSRFDNKANAFVKTPYVKKPIQIIEINGADTIKLDEIKGVGAAFARRIAKYRDRIGGFHKKEQLLEVFGLDSAKYDEIKEQVSIDETLVKKININEVQFADLKSHPYLNFKQINAIINYRKQHGDYKSIDDLRKVILLDNATIQRLTPYINY